MIRGDRDLGRAVKGVGGLGVEHRLVPRRIIGVMHVPLGITGVGMPNRDVTPIVRRTMDRHRAQNHFAVAGSLVLVLEGADIGLRPGCHAVAREPGPADALFEDCREDRVVCQTRRRNQDGDETLGGLIIEETLIPGGIDAMHGNPGGAAALDPDGRIARVPGVAINTQGNHPVTLTGKIVEVRLVLGGGDAVIGLEQGVPSLGGMVRAGAAERYLAE